MLSIALVVGLLLCIIQYHHANQGNFNDISINQFTPEGHIAQIIYAAEAIQKSPPVIGLLLTDPLINDDYILLLSANKAPSNLMTNNGLEDRIHRVGNIAVVTAGYDPDCRIVASFINNMIHAYHLQYGNHPSLDYLAHKAAIWLTRGMYDNEDEDSDNNKSNEDILTRPLACSVILAGYDDFQGYHRMITVNNGGTIHENSLIASLGAVGDGKIGRLYNTMLQCKREKTLLPRSIEQLVEFLESQWDEELQIVTALIHKDEFVKETKPIQLKEVGKFIMKNI